MVKPVSHLIGCQKKEQLDLSQFLNDFTNQESQQLSENQQYSPNFSTGDEVVWAYVSAHDYGVVVSRIWVDETVHKVTGWHYLVRLHPNSRSYSLCKEDWAFEADLELLSEFKKQAEGSLE
jgi:hypothetical protein